ncbi:hypothetical protein B1B_14552, partial [mine drainage metagenome]
MISLTQLLRDHWVTPQSVLEQLSLPALDAYIQPPEGTHGFYAAAVREVDVVGPVPDGRDDERLAPLVEELNRRRAPSTDPVVVAPLLRDIETHYLSLVLSTWPLLWRCHNREAQYPEAPSVSRRWADDRQAYTGHIDWTMQGGRRRTRQTVRQAAMTLRDLEQEQSRLDAEEACDDPLRMIPYLLDHKAVQGTVVHIDRNHREVARKNRVGRPLVTICSPDPCLMP